MKRFLILGLVALLSGCQGWQHVKNESQTEITTSSYSVSVPKGWVKHVFNNQTTLSKDGVAVNLIIISRLDHDDAFKTIKKQSSVSLLPEELGNLFYSNIRSEYETAGLKVNLESNKPVIIDGRDGFHIHMRAIGDKGLRIGIDVKGVATDKGLYFLQYQAPILVYYSRSINDFNQIVNSMRLKG